MSVYDYINKYRVDIERDINGDVVDEGITYLRCVGRGKGNKVYRYDNDTLVYYVCSKGKGNNMYKEIIDRGVSATKTEYDGEVDIYFSEKDLELIADILCVTTTGASIVPKSIKNHPRRKEIKAEKDALLTNEEREKRRLQGERLRQIKEDKNSNKND